MALTPIPQNYRNNVDWILGAYTDAGVSFPNGFQKDAIQNAVGAKKQINGKTGSVTFLWLKMPTDNILLLRTQVLLG